ncbi:MAG: YabP/YqfC family sporulation protein [Clostridia bacterium]|nr:YabP/YqfC family sporulation protein [Clostridia bacterium]
MKRSILKDNFLSSPTFELQGKRLLQADGVMTLIEYSRDRVVLLCREGRISIRGEGLKVSLLSRERAVVSGLITGFDFI